MHTRQSRQRRTVAVLAGIFASAAVAFAQPSNPPPANAQSDRVGQSVERTLALPAPKAEALFGLLAPQRVRVLVSKTADGVSVRGTAREVETIAAFANVLTRDQGKDYSADEAALAELKKTWDSKETYQPPQDSTEALYKALAFNDVPVFVEHAGAGVTIEASRNDQEVIGRVVRIVKGETLDDTPLPPTPQKPEAPPQEPKPRGEGRNDGRIATLERRIVELEKRLAALEANKPADSPIAQAEPNKPQPATADLIDRRYELSPPHVDNLFTLFAPGDITSVVVSREGNQLRIRASAKDHTTIKRLVELLNRGSGKNPDATAQATPSGT